MQLVRLEDQGTAEDISKYADYTSKAPGAASFIPGVGELAAPAAGVAKGVSYIGSLFELCLVLPVL